MRAALLVLLALAPTAAALDVPEGVIVEAGPGETLRFVAEGPAYAHLAAGPEGARVRGPAPTDGLGGGREGISDYGPSGASATIVEGETLAEVVEGRVRATMSAGEPLRAEADRNVSLVRGAVFPGACVARWFDASLPSAPRSEARVVAEARGLRLELLTTSLEVRASGEGALEAVVVDEPPWAGGGLVRVCAPATAETGTGFYVRVERSPAPARQDAPATGPLAALALVAFVAAARRAHAGK